jgi:hypothetical protein
MAYAAAGVPSITELELITGKLGVEEQLIAAWIFN